MKKLDYLCNCRSEISNVYNVVDSHCLQAMKIVHYYANGCFDWLISGQQSFFVLITFISAHLLQVPSVISFLTVVYTIWHTKLLIRSTFKSCPLQIVIISSK